MIGEFIEASVLFQNDTIWTMYAIIAVGVFATAFMMFKSANK